MLLNTSSPEKQKGMKISMNEDLFNNYSSFKMTKLLITQNTKYFFLIIILTNVLWGNQLFFKVKTKIWSRKTEVYQFID